MRPTFPALAAIVSKFTSFTARRGRVPLWLGLVLAATLLTSRPAHAQVVGFTDVFAPGNWIFTSGGAGSSVTWAPGNTAFTLTAALLFNDGPTLTYFKVDNLASVYLISFDWSYTTNDPWGPQYDPAGFNSTTLSDSAGPASQSGNVTDASVYTVLQFFTYSDNWADLSDGTSSLTISNFSFTATDSGGGDGGDTGTSPTATSAWSNTTGNWTNAGNWSGGLPTADSQANITTNATVNVTTATEAHSVYLETSTLNVTGDGTLTLANAQSDLVADYGASLHVSGADAALTTGGLILYTANATFEQGATITSSHALLTGFADNVATVTVRTGATWNSGELTVGGYGQGTLHVQSGATVNAGDVVVGYDTTAHGVINVSGAGSTLNTGHLHVANFGDGTVTISDGAVVNSTQGAVAAGAAGPGNVGLFTVTGPGSQWNIASNTLRIAAAASEEYFTSGTLTIADGGTVKVGPTGTGTVTLETGGTLRIGTGGLAGTLQAGAVAFDYPTGSVYPVLAFHHTDNTTFSAAISGRGHVTKAGSGSLTLSGTHTYTGTTTLNGGELNVRGSLANSAVTVNSGATLSGSGTVGALTLNPGSTLAPGNSPGTLTVTDDVVWNGGANYVWEINDASSPATGAGTRYDLLSISGTLTLNATAANPFTLSLVSLLANHSAGDVIHFNAAQNSAYTIATTTGGILGFDASAFTINPASFSNSLAGGTWSVALANSNRDLALNFTASAAAIPEPSTYAALFGATVLALAAYRRRQLRVSARVAITTRL